MICILYHIYRDPTSHNDIFFGAPCIAAFGGPIDPTIALGDFGKLLYRHGICMYLRGNLSWVIKTMRRNFCGTN